MGIDHEWTRIFMNGEGGAANGGVGVLGRRKEGYPLGRRKES
jgi:hypothetical protein